MQKNILLVVIGMVVLLLLSFLWTGRNGEMGGAPGKVVRRCNASFEEFKVKGSYRGIPAAVDFKTDPRAEEFKTAITEAAAQGPNFAGHYTVATWGCGTACQSSAIVDARTGAIKAFGILSAHGLKFSTSSALFSVNPEENFLEGAGVAGTNIGTDYYEMKENNLEFLCKKPFGLKRSVYECNKEHIVARNPLTGDLRGLETLCDAPSGWDAAPPPREPGA